MAGMADVCKKCTTEVKTNQNGVACELCGLWYHAKCVGITNETYKFFKSCSVNDEATACASGHGGVMWFCYECMGPASKIIRNMSAIYKRQDEFEECLKLTNNRVSSIEMKLEGNKREFESKLNESKHEMHELHQHVSEMQQQMVEVNVKLQTMQNELQMKCESTQWSDIVSQAVDTKFETVSAGINMVERSIEKTKQKALEFKDKEERRNNVILYKVPECAPGSYEEVVKHDSDFFVDACTNALDLEVTREDIKKVYRIGKRGSEARPLLVCLSSGMLKNHIMESTFKLRKIEKFKHIVISHDMTKQEREQCKQLVAEAKQQEAQEPAGEFIFRVRGPPGNMKVVKLRKRV